MAMTREYTCRCDDQKAWPRSCRRGGKSIKPAPRLLPGPRERVRMACRNRTLQRAGRGAPKRRRLWTAAPTSAR